MLHLLCLIKTLKNDRMLDFVLTAEFGHGFMGLIAGWFWMSVYEKVR